MQTLVSARRSAFNNARTAVSAPTRFHVVAAKIVSPDRLTVALRGEFEGTFDAAKRHALAIARTVADRHGCDAIAEVLDIDNALLFCAEVTR